MWQIETNRLPLTLSTMQAESLSLHFLGTTSKYSLWRKDQWNMGVDAGSMI
jgi:hypothetical protein